jgi:hypothetical protein
MTEPRTPLPQSDGTIEGCPLGVKCDKLWQDLELTSIQAERHCHTCGTVVTLCTTQDELLRLKNEGKCVSFDIRKGERIVRLVGMPATRSDKLRKYLDDL